MRSTECDVTSGRGTEVNSGKPAYADGRRNHCIKQLDVLLHRRNTSVTKDIQGYYN